MYNREHTLNDESRGSTGCSHLSYPFARINLSSSGMSTEASGEAGREERGLVAFDDLRGLYDELLLLMRDYV